MPSQVFTTVGTTQWTWPAGALAVTVECLGGGGAGGNATGNPSTGGGGKGGSYVKGQIQKGAETFLDVTVGGPGQSSYVGKSGTPYVRGCGGVQGGVGASNSSNGVGATGQVDTPLGTEFVGGNGGQGNFTSGAQGSGAGGGAGGPTGAGGNGAVNAGGIAGTGAWGNGSTYQAAGRNGVGDSTAGLAGIAYGGGGSGGKANANADRLGGAGSQGVVVLSWVFKLALGATPATGGFVGGDSITDNIYAMFSGGAAAVPKVGNSMALVVTFFETSGAGGATFANGDVTDDNGNTWLLATQMACVGWGQTSPPAAGPDQPEAVTAVFYCPMLSVVTDPYIVRINFAGTSYGYFNAQVWEVTGGQGPLHVVGYAASVSQFQQPQTNQVNAPAASCTVASFVRAWQVNTLSDYNASPWEPLWNEAAAFTTGAEAAAGATRRFGDGVNGTSPIASWDTNVAGGYWTNAMIIVAFDAPQPGPTAVTGVTIARTSVVNVPSVAPGAVTITGVTRATTAVLYVPGVVAGPALVTTATIAAGSVLNLPTVVPGPVAATAPTIPAGSTLAVPTVAPGGRVSDNLVAYWPLDEASGNALDVAGTTPLTAINAPGTTTGKVVTARTFARASNRYFRSANVPALQVPNTDFSFSVWVFLQGASGMQTIFGKDQQNVAETMREYTLEHDLSGLPAVNQLRWYVRGLTNPAKWTGITQNVWHHVVCVYETATKAQRLYVDGAGPVTAFGTTAMTYTGNEFRVGTSYDAGPGRAFESNSLDGALDELSMWKRALSASEVAWLYNGGAGRSYAEVNPPVSVDQAVGGVTIASAAVTQVPTVAPGPVTISGATMAAAAVLTSPSVVPGAVAISGATIAASSVPNVPTVAPGAVTVSGATIAAASLARVPVVAPGPVTISGATIASGALARVPTVAPGPVPASGATIVSGSVLSPPAVVPGLVLVSGSTIGSTVALFALAVAQGQPVTNTTFAWLL